MKPWVSIITPVYNGVEFLEQCAMSIYLQEGNIEWEWLIGVNGHGTGGEVLKRAMEIKAKCHDRPIRVVNLPDAKGKVDALNTLKAMATGDWIALLDCDDTWERNKLQFQKVAIDRSSKIDVIGTFCRYFGDYISDGPKLPAGFIDEVAIWRGNPIINSSVLIRRELADWEDRFGLEDYDLWFRLIRKGKVFFNVPYHLVNHRLHTGSAFNGKGKQDVDGLIRYHAAHI
jgi:glycosyltransferase involved in cell wall biosynthesis